jgi:hypothetical protein
MARAEKLVTIKVEGRDTGKTYLITEMPPRVGEKWAARALFALGKAGHGEMPEGYREELERAGMAGIAAIGVRALTSMDFADAEPLLDEMLTCVTFVPDPGKIDQTTMKPIARTLIESDIEEISTILTLRSEVLEVHTGFSIAAFLSRIGAAAKAQSSFSTIPTSPE